MRHTFISEYADDYSVALMCEVLKALRIGYYRYRHHLVSRHENTMVRLLAEIRSVHAKCRDISGARAFIGNWSCEVMSVEATAWFA